MQKELNLFRYFMIFCAVYAVAQGSIFAILAVLKAGGGGAGTTTAALAGTVYYVCSIFIKEFERLPEKAEKLKLALVSLLGSFVVSGIFVAVYLIAATGNEANQLIELLSEINATIMVVISSVLTAFYFLLIWFFYVIFSKLQSNRLTKKEKI